MPNLTSPLPITAADIVDFKCSQLSKQKLCSVRPETRQQFHQC